MKKTKKKLSGHSTLQETQNVIVQGKQYPLNCSGKAVPLRINSTTL